MRLVRDLIKWSLAGIVLLLPQSGFTRMHQSPLMESQGVCETCDRQSFFDGLQQNIDEIVRPVKHGPRVYRAAAPVKRQMKRRVKPKQIAKVRSKPRVKASPKPVKLSSHYSPSGSAFMRAIAHAARMGAGNAGHNMCYASVKRILARGGLKSWLPGGSAWQAGRDLQRAGFRRDMNACSTPGTVRVYNGLGSGRMSEAATMRIAIQRYGRYTKGDYHGHVEVVGEDGKYYYNPGGATRPMNELSPRRRTLTGCYVK